MSIQLMYLRSASTLSNEYVKDGYEASFGSYDVDEATHTMAHHVQGSSPATCLSARTCHAFTSSPRMGT
ncbi:MAG TPA: hypothetical protein VEK33_12065 [Terriglobales bacterium]|nr:hypothetical protein [Terriglobales bacterium]